MKLFEVTQPLNKKEFNLSIQRDCSEFIQKTQDTEYYRGILNKQNDLYIKRDIRSDRTPSNTATHFNALFNGLLEHRFKIPRIRNTCLFITTNRNVAASYGHAYQVFLPDGGKFVFNQNVEDFYVDSAMLFEYPFFEWCIQNEVKIDAPKFNLDLATYVNLRQYNNIDTTSFSVIDISMNDTLNDLQKKTNGKIMSFYDYLTRIEPRFTDYKMTDYIPMHQPQRFEIMVVGIDYFYAKQHRLSAKT